jgi:predicted DCC family thiol-disulfide oxidoreductase YuxK
MMYHVIYDGNCNLCVNLVKFLEQLDQGQQFRYAPMQDLAVLEQFGIAPQTCEMGLILIQDEPSRRWQGSAAAEEIGRRLPAGASFVDAYRAIPGLKGLGDRFYEQIRDNRYQLFGRRDTTYQSTYPVCAGECSRSEA